METILSYYVINAQNICLFLYFISQTLGSYALKDSSRKICQSTHDRGNRTVPTLCFVDLLEKILQLFYSFPTSVALIINLWLPTNSGVHVINVRLLPSISLKTDTCVGSTTKISFTSYIRLES